MKTRKPLVVIGVLIIGGIIACQGAATSTAVPAAPVGLKIGERFHEIHTSKLQLKCETCHTTNVQTYNDPLAQVANLADRRACLGCHKEGGAQPFYGEDWSKAKVGR